MLHPKVSLLTRYDTTREAVSTYGKQSVESVESVRKKKR